MRLLSPFAHLSVAIGYALLTGCGGGTAPLAPQESGVPLRSPVTQREAKPNTAILKTPALIATDLTTGALVYWPRQRQDRHHPITFTKSLGAYGGYGMAANGDVLVIANSNPPEIITYNVKSKRMRALKDDYGLPYDVAIDKKGNIYAMNTASLTLYPAGMSSERRVTCDRMTDNAAIGADDEGDIFVNGTDRNNLGVVEYPANGGKCKAMNLQPELGYSGGVGVDPKTDDLIVIDNPGVCAGGPTRMTIYPRPYNSTKFTRANLHATYCDGMFRLDKDSKHIYLADQTYNIDGEVIDVRTYPAGAGHGYYSRQFYGSYDFIGGFTTIPNALPN